MHNVNRDIFYLVTVKNGKADNAAIMGIFSDMAAGRLKNDISVVSVVNYHNEVPVCYSAAITEVKEDSIDLKVHPNQALIIKQYRHTLIKSQYFSNNLSVHCFAAFAKVSSGMVVLHNFAYAQIKAERREALRVTSNVPVPITFSYNDAVVRGEMMDISLSGISIVLDPTLEISQDQLGVLDITLMDIPLTIPTTFIKSMDSDDVRVGVCTMVLDRESEKVVSQFIYHRQVEIINELRENVDLNR